MIIEEVTLDKNIIINVRELIDSLKEVLDVDELEHIYKELKIEERAAASSNGNSFRKIKNFTGF